MPAAPSLPRNPPRSVITPLSALPVAIEKVIQALIECQVFDRHGIRFLSRELSMGQGHGGCLDTLDIDPHDAPGVVVNRPFGSAHQPRAVPFRLAWLLDPHPDYFQWKWRALGPPQPQ